MATSTPTTTSPTATAGDNTGLLVGAWVTAFLFWPVGIVLSIIGKNKGDSRFKAPLIVSIIFGVLAILWVFFIGSLVAGMAK